MTVTKTHNRTATTHTMYVCADTSAPLLTPPPPLFHFHVYIRSYVRTTSTIFKQYLLIQTASHPRLPTPLHLHPCMINTFAITCTYIQIPFTLYLKFPPSLTQHHQTVPVSQLQAPPNAASSVAQSSHRSSWTASKTERRGCGNKQTTAHASPVYLLQT